MGNSKIKLVNRYGLDFEETKLSITSRETIATNIFNYFSKQEDNSEFMSSMVQFVSKGQIPEDGQLSISLDDPDLQQFCILYGTKMVMDQALDENLSEAYTLLCHYTQDPKYRDKEITELDDESMEELGKYYTLTPELSLAKQICDIQLEINASLSGHDNKILTSFQANRIQEKFEELSPYLDFEQRAAGYYNISIIHRALLGEKDLYDPNKNDAEKDCLKKVLEYTSDYKRIGYCANRLSSSKDNAALIRAAYRRALTVADSDNDLYKINLALGDCYIENLNNTIGFRQEPRLSLEQQKMERAELYYSDALLHAQEPERLNILKKIARLQKWQGKNAEWSETMTTMAMKHMTGEERCHTLMKVARVNPDLREVYLDRVIYEAAHAKGLTKDKKHMIIANVAQELRPIYQHQSNLEGLASLDRIMARFAPKREILSNPLLKYKKRKSR